MIDKREEAAITNEIRAKGIELGEHGECVPADVAPLVGGSGFNILAFFSDKTGTHFLHKCWNSKIHEKVLANIELIRNNIIKTGTHSFTIKLDWTNNSFVEILPRDEHSFSQMEGRLFRDRLEVTIRFIGSLPGVPVSEVMPEQKRVYRFYKFNELPPKRDNLIIVYKRSSSE